MLGLALASLERIMQQSEHEQLKKQLCDGNFFKENRVLILLDGFDEASPESQCEELHNFLTTDSARRQPLQYDVILSTRPGYTSSYYAPKQLVEVVGFDTTEQKTSYIKAHFAYEKNSKSKIAIVQKVLQENENLNTLAETPLLLTFICLLHENIQSGSLFEIYSSIIWYLLDRYQKSFPEEKVPMLFSHQSITSQNELLTIQNDYLKFPALIRLGKMAFQMFQTVEFTDADLEKYQIPEIIVSVGLLRKEERRDKSLRIITEYVFPHRTFQEFLAGGMWYFWPEIELSLPESAKAQKFAHIFHKSVDHCSEEEKEFVERIRMDELEKYIWRIALKANFEMEQQLLSFFRRYETLAIDLSIFPKKSDKSRFLNAYLKECKNLTGLVVYSSLDAKAKLSSTIKLSHLYSLQTVHFLNIMIIDKVSNNIFSAVTLPVACDSQFKGVIFTGCEFRAHHFLKTLEAIRTNALKTTTLGFVRTEVREPATKVKNQDISAVMGYFSSADFFSSIYVPEIENFPLSADNQENNELAQLTSNTPCPSLLHVLGKIKCAKEIKITELLPQFKPLFQKKLAELFPSSFEGNLPLFERLVKLDVANCFYILSNNSFPLLKEFSFESSIVDNDKWQKLAGDIGDQKHLTKLSLLKMPPYFEPLTQLQCSHCIEEFIIEIVDEVWPLENGANATLSLLARNMLRLRAVHISTNYSSVISFIDEYNIRETGKLRLEEFDFIPEWCNL